ncbi:MAG: hypothetical protein QM820_54855 [Minicystis sp.]
MQKSLWIGSLFLMISGSLLGCEGAEGTLETSESRPFMTGALTGEEGKAGTTVFSAEGDTSHGEGLRSTAGGPYPAPHPSMPVITNHGGKLLHDPVIVTVTFPGDPLAGKLEAFGDEVGSLDWWQKAVGPYGAQAATSGGNVRIAEAPATRISDDEVSAWVASKIDDGTFPPPTDQTLYTLYYPASTTVTLDSAVSCQTFLGYHSAFQYDMGNGRTMPVAYTVINRCGSLDQVTETASHEFAEAASDPHPLTVDTLGYMLLSSNAWTILGGENADMCAGVSGVRENDWALTRVWNNQNAARGQQPCVPAMEGSTPYFNAGIVNDTISAQPGTTVTTEVDCYSFGPLPAPMQLERPGLRP